MAIMRLGLGLLLFVCASVPADVYKYTDASGNVVFTDKPVEGRGLKLEWKRTTARLVEENKRHLFAYRKVPKNAPPSLGKSAKERRAQLEGLIHQTALRHRLPPELLHAVIRAESAYNPSAVSSAGAIGLMQLMPGTAERYHVPDIWDPAANLDGGAAYLRDLLDLFDKDLRLALAGYNAGENAVIRHGRNIPPYPETQTYVRKVLQFLWAEQASLGQLSMR